MKYFAALGIALLVIAAASVGPWAPSPYTSQTGTNTTAAAWRVALGVTSSASLTNAALVGGTVVNQTNTSLTAARVLVTDANKVPTNSAVTTTTLGYLDATSSIQTQMDSKPTVALTNLALLNASQTFTQTNTFSNTNSVWAGTASRYLPLVGGSMTGTIWGQAVAYGATFPGGYGFSGATNTGLWASTGAGNLGLWLNNTPRLVISSGGDFRIPSDQYFGWSSATDNSAAADTFIGRDAANVVAFRNRNSGSTPQTNRIYQTYTDASNYQRLAIYTTASSVVVAAETDGTGADNIDVKILPAGTGGVVIGSSGAAISTVLSATATLNFDLTALVVEDLTITVTGAASGDTVSIGVPAGSVTATVQFTGWVSAADTVTIRARTSVVGENPASGTFRATVTKF